jgi:hypothetical protein
MSNFTKYSDILDPEEIQKLVGEQWLNMPEVVKAGIVRRDPRSMQGSLTSEIRQKIFQGRSGQALAAGDTISFANKSQEKANMPNLWRYDGLNLPDVIEAIMVKDVPRENAEIAAGIQLAASQYVDNSVIATLEGSAAALGDNLTDYSGTGTIELVAIINAKAKAKDKRSTLDTGAIIMHSKVYFDAVKLGLVALTANTMGIAAQDAMVASGKLPTNILGLTPIVTDKLAISGDNYYSYLVGMNALVLRGNDAPIVEVGRPDDTFATLTKFMVSYGVGVPGMKWGVSGSEKITDVQLATSGNWTLAANANSNDVSIYRLQTK